MDFISASVQSDHYLGFEKTPQLAEFGVELGLFSKAVDDTSGGESRSRTPTRKPVMVLYLLPYRGTQSHVTQHSVSVTKT